MRKCLSFTLFEVVIHLLLTFLTAVLKPVDADAELAIGVLLAYDLDVLRKKVRPSKNTCIHTNTYDAYIDIHMNIHAHTRTHAHAHAHTFICPALPLSFSLFLFLSHYNLT